MSEINAMKHPSEFVVPMAFDSHGGAIKAVYPIKDALLFVNGATGCTFFTRLLFGYADNFYIRMLSSGIEEKHVIFGGEEVLEEGLEKAVRVCNPELIVVQNTCIPLLIGDDVAGIARSVSQRTGVKIISSDNPNYRGNQLDGFQNVINDYIAQLMESPRQVIKKSVNLLGVMPSEYNWRADLREIKRILRAIGLSINCTLVGYDTLVKDIINAPQAEANVLLYPEVGLPSAELMKERFNTPYIETDLPPIGINSTREWVLRIAEHFGLTQPAESFLEEELGEMGDALGELDTQQIVNMQYLFGKTYAIKAKPFQLPGMVKFLYEDLRMRPTTIAFQEFDESSLARLQKVLRDNGLSPEIQTRGDHDEFMEAITKNHIYPYGDPWIVFGSSIDATELASGGHRLPVIRYAFPVLDEAIISNNPFVGLRGVVFLTQLIFNEIIKKLWGSEDAAGNFQDPYLAVQQLLAPYMVD